jgi:hypothetical protein
MSLDEWAAIAEIIGAIAVVATLAYLAMQIRQSNRATRSANATTVLINTQNLAQAPMMDRELGDIILRTISGEGELSPSEKLAAYAWFYLMLKTGELAHQSYLHGELDQEYWDASISFYRSYYQTPGFRTYWSERKGAFTPGFRESVEKWMHDESTPVTTADELYNATQY